jgi:K+-sensing histidine kinase KdpD
LNVVPIHARDAEARREGAAASAEVGEALAQGLDVQLSALRASIESLRDALSSDSAGRQVASNVLQQVDRLGRNVRDLMDFATPPRPRPTRCTASEIVLCARGALPEDARARVIVALERTDDVLCIDGPLLVRSLLRLLERAIDLGSPEILLFARREDGRTVFGVVDAASRSLRDARRQKDLSLAVVGRDLELLDGSLEIRSSAPGETCVSLSVPATPIGPAS